MKKYKILKTNGETVDKTYTEICEELEIIFVEIHKNGKIWFPLCKADEIWFLHSQIKKCGYVPRYVPSFIPPR